MLNRGVTGHVLVTREQQVQMVNLIFLARELQHPSLYIALLDQLVASVWVSDVFLEAVDCEPLAFLRCCKPVMS